MSAQTDAAAAEFQAAMDDPRNLVEIHKDLNPRRGRRYRETTLNRAMVVLTVAAWQAYVQDLTRAILDTIQPPAGDPANVQFQLIRAATLTALGRFNTPDARNTCNLLANVGFDPLPHWSWKRGRWALTIDDATRSVDEWLRVRHTIAHGSALPAVKVIARTTAGVPTLTRGNSERSISFFAQLVNVTRVAADAQFP